MGLWLGALEGADQLFNQGRATNWLGQKAGQFGHWLGDVTGANGAKPVTPSYQVDYGRMNEDRARQSDLYGQYQQMAAGNGPSLAQGQLQQATDQNIRQAMALGAAQQGQGLGYASALRGIADQSAAARQQAAAQSALIRNQEQMQAMGAMGGLGGQMFGQDLAQQNLGAQNAYQYDALNANIDAQNAAGRRQLTGGVMNAAGALGGAALGGMAHGGMVPGYASGGLTAYESPGRERMESPIHERAETAGQEAMEHGRSGGRVPGYARGGDSSRNDTVPAMLSPGEIVIPRSITMAPNAGELSKMFVEMVQQHRQKLPSSDEHPVVRDAMRRKKAA